MPKAIQKEPHVLCTAAPSPSLARNACWPAMNCAIPPNTIANGNTMSGVLTLPYQPACHAPIIIVAPMNPYSPTIDGGGLSEFRCNWPDTPSGLLGGKDQS